MRTLLILGLFTLAVFSGCADKAPAAEAPANPVAVATAPPLPAAIYDNQTVMASADPLNLLDVVPVGPLGGLCSTPDSFCMRYPFSVGMNQTVNLTAELVWETVGNDFDMYLVQGETVVSNDGINNLGSTNPADYTATSQTMHFPTPEGDYEVLIVGWLAVQDSYSLVVEFT